MLPDGWARKTIGQVAKVTSGGTPSRTVEEFWNGDIPWITTGLVNFNVISKALEQITPEGLANSSAKLFPPKTLLVALYGDGVTRGKVAMLGIEAATNQACAAILPSETALPEFMFYYIAANYEALRRESADGNQKNLSGNLIKSFPLLLPPLAEQQKIATILSTWDRAIELTEKLIAATQKRKQALMQQLLTGKVRFKEYKGKPWTWVEIGKLTKQVKRPIVWDEDQLYKLASIRRHSKGMFFREPAYGHQIKVKKLYTIEKNDFLISNIQAAYGAMGLVPKKFDNTYISDQYTVLAANDEKKFDIHFLGFVSETPWFRQQILLACNGFFAERLRLLFSADELLKRKLFVPPSIKEQRRIAEVLHTAVRELRSAEKRLKHLKEQKKGLMQQLLTGKVRVNVDTEMVKG